MMARTLLAAAALLLAGCGHVTTQQVKVPVPVECRVDVPGRPAMPTESLAPGVSLDSYVAASQAEIEIREGYEGELRAALVACTEPQASLGVANRVQRSTISSADVRN